MLGKERAMGHTGNILAGSSSKVRSGLHILPRVLGWAVDQLVGRQVSEVKAAQVFCGTEVLLREVSYRKQTALEKFPLKESNTVHKTTETSRNGTEPEETAMTK